MSWTRGDHLSRFDGATVDAVVIGGGIVGGGAALDLAERGASVAIVEMDDFAAGTSGKSTKLFHGGIRYMPQLRFGLVREGLREQVVLAETVDYLYWPLDFVIPMYRGVSFGDLPALLGHHRLVPTALRAGLFLYDRLGGRKDGHRKIGASEAVELVPSLRTDGLKGAFVYRDAQTDDARLTVGVVKAAVDRGAIALNHATVTEVARTPEGYIVTAVDSLNGHDVSVFTKAVIAAAGSAPPPSPEATEPLGLRYSRGSHLITTLDAVGLAEHAVVLPETEDERILYMIPWLKHGLVGTTDVPTEDGASAVASDEEVEYLIRHVERYTQRRPVPLSTFAGMRALAASRGATARASRREVVRELSPRFFQVAGGKLTGYRIIAEEVADKVAGAIGLDRPSSTRHLPIAGAGSGSGRGPLRDRYGSLSSAVLAIADRRPELATTLSDGSLKAEVVYAAAHEGAATIADFTLRRTRLSWFTPDHGRDAAAEIATLMGDELGWSASEKDDQLLRFEAALVAEGL